MFISSPYVYFVGGGGVNSIHKYIHVHNLKIGLFISPACLFVCFLTETLTCFDNSNFISKLKKEHQSNIEACLFIRCSTAKLSKL